MLKKFEVTNFKGFKDKLVFDLSAREYAFNKHIIKNDIVNKAIIYGKNGIGKSNLGIAIFDIVMHLSDKERMPSRYLQNYLNLNSNQDFAEFTYQFCFDDDEVIYSYKKQNPFYLIDETLTINGKLMIRFDYFKRENNYLDREVVGDLKIDLLDNRLSVIKYIYRNVPMSDSSPLYKMMLFVDNMLWYRGLSDGNNYCGFTNGAASLIESLYVSGKKNEFQKFLAENGVFYELDWQINYGIHELMVVFSTGKRVPFLSIASTGTQSLLLFFFWSISFNRISFLFIDEFDAFFHYEAAEIIIQLLNKNKSFQSMVTSHNTYLMQNKLTRPDCCYLMTENKIKNLFDSTEKEIREAHNLEKMYINGAFGD